MSDNAALTRLVGDADTFLTDVFGQHPWHHQTTETFTDLLSLDDVDQILAGTGLRAPSFRMVHHGVTLPQKDVTRQVRIGSRPVPDLADIAAIHRAFSDGASLVLQGLHRSFAPVATLSRALEMSLTHPVQANAYLTPPVAQGLNLHGDPHDVFAIQTHGVKRWVVHPPNGEVWDLELKPGDVLYLPAGVRHAAQTIDQPSLHLTIGVRTTGWADVVRRAVNQAFERAEFDDALPAGWANDPEQLITQTRRYIRAVVHELDDPTLADDAVAASARSFWRNRPPDLTGGLRDLLELDHLDDHSNLRVRANVSCHFEVDDDRVKLVLGDRTLVLPATLEPTLRFIVQAHEFTPLELDEMIDHGSRLVLCRRLVREGLLTFERGARGADRADD